MCSHNREATADFSIKEIPHFIKMIKALSAWIALLFNDNALDVVFIVSTGVMLLYYGKIITNGKPEETRHDPNWGRYI